MATTTNAETGVTVVFPRLAHFVRELADLGLVVTVESDGIRLLVTR